jgi:hypothetical protein
MGELGMTKKRKIPQSMVMGLKMRKRYCHRPNEPFRWPTPLETPSPINAATDPPNAQKDDEN